MVIFPAGLLCSQVEIFGRDFKVSGLTNGNTLSFDNFPQELKNDLQEKLNIDIVAKKALAEWGIPEKDQLERYTFCMWGGFDDQPDYNHQNELSKPEYQNHCGLRGNCRFEGKCCTGFIAPNGKLSKRELEVIVLIAKCYSDKVICFELEISQDTLRNHKNSIEHKIGAKGKVAMAIFAHKHKLL